MRFKHVPFIISFSVQASETGMHKWTLTDTNNNTSLVAFPVLTKKKMES